MTNYEFAMRTAQIAKRAAGWSHDTMTMGAEAQTEETSAETARRFCEEICDLLLAISPR